MTGHVILSHGLDSSPDSRKAVALAKIAESLGWSSARPDYRDVDASRDVREVSKRTARLIEACRGVSGPLVLAGSSMGAYVSALASLEVRVLGLFLMAPPVKMEGYPRALAAARVPTFVVHGWRDEMIPAGDVVRWAQRRHDRLLMLDDGHRLEHHVELVAAEFGRFLQSLS